MPSFWRYGKRYGKPKVREMSDLAAIKNLDGHPAVFCRFDGANRFVLYANGEFRTVTRDYWMSLSAYEKSSLRAEILALIRSTRMMSDG
jgi:hypothetical protein